MDLSSVSRLVGIENWTHALEVIRTMSEREAALTLVGLASGLAETEKLGFLRPNDDLYALRSAVSIVAAMTGAQYDSPEPNDPWRDRVFDDPTKVEPPF